MFVAVGLTCFSLTLGMLNITGRTISLGVRLVRGRATGFVVCIPVAAGAATASKIRVWAPPGLVDVGDAERIVSVSGFGSGAAEWTLFAADGAVLGAGKLRSCPVGGVLSGPAQTAADRPGVLGGPAMLQIARRKPFLGDVTVRRIVSDGARRRGNESGSRRAIGPASRP